MKLELLAVKAAGNVSVCGAAIVVYEAAGL